MLQWATENAFHPPPGSSFSKVPSPSLLCVYPSLNLLHNDQGLNWNWTGTHKCFQVFSDRSTKETSYLRKHIWLVSLADALNMSQRGREIWIRWTNLLHISLLRKKTSSGSILAQMWLWSQVGSHRVDYLRDCILLNFDSGLLAPPMHFLETLSSPLCIVDLFGSLPDLFLCPLFLLRWAGFLSKLLWVEEICVHVPPSFFFLSNFMLTLPSETEFQLFQWTLVVSDQFEGSAIFYQEYLLSGTPHRSCVIFWSRYRSLNHCGLLLVLTDCWLTLAGTWQVLNIFFMKHKSLTFL